MESELGFRQAVRREGLCLVSAAGRRELSSGA